MKKIHLSIFILIFVLLGCNNISAKPTKDTYKVSRIVDGDTIVLSNNAVVRYIGINTPETRKRIAGNWAFSPEPYALKAKEFNAGLINREKVKLRFDKVKRDKYNRLLAYVFNQKGKLINLELIKKGYAVVYTFPPNLKYYEDFIEAQETARKNKSGIWGELVTITHKNADRYIDRIVNIRGRINHISERRNKVVLQFEKRKNAMSCIIYRRNLSFFEKKGYSKMRTLVNKDVIITGKIIFKNGLKIVIDNPNMIKVVE